jgi:hypothetical protein
MKTSTLKKIPAAKAKRAAVRFGRPPKELAGEVDTRILDAARGNCDACRAAARRVNLKRLKNIQAEHDREKVGVRHRLRYFSTQSSKE